MWISDVLLVWLRFTVMDFSETPECTTYSLATDDSGSPLFTAILSVNILFNAAIYNCLLFLVCIPQIIQMLKQKFPSEVLSDQC